MAKWDPCRPNVSTRIAESYGQQPVAVARVVVLLAGDATDGIQTALRDRGYDAFLGPFDSMESAVWAAKSAARPGSVVLLAPGATSFGMFADEFDRGERFKDSVLGLPADDHGAASAAT
jgi:UDP-N-acetylmuramoylalanine-D-glutamate ligase